MTDIIIIGSGPAGLTAAIYAQRAGLQALVIEKQPMSGGQIVNTADVDNYPGMPGIGGFELGMSFHDHAQKLGAAFVTEEVRAIESVDKSEKVVVTAKERYSCRAIVLAMGASYRMLGVPGERELRGMGVSYCATCDGAFFRGKTVAVIGGGDVALGDALFLARGCEKVYLIHRRDTFRGAGSLQEKVFATPNIEIIYDSVAKSIVGDGMVQMLQIINKKTMKKSDIFVQGVFVAVGMEPNTQLVRALVDCDAGGYVCADETCKTSIPGIYAAGDLRTKQLRQVVTAAADGANAIASAEMYLQEK